MKFENQEREMGGGWAYGTLGGKGNRFGVK